MFQAIKSIGLETKSLFCQLQNGFKRTNASQKLRQKIKYRSSRPDKFKLVSKLGKFDLTKPNLSFPISIPLKLKYVYQPQKHAPHLPTHDFINFKTMTGNEILLNLENYENLRASEICGALIELSKREGHEEINWNEHEWVAATTEHVSKMIPTYTPSVVCYLMVAFQRLRITHEKLWKNLTFAIEKTIHKFNAKSFAYTYIAYLEDTNRSSEEFRKKLVELLPIHLHQMNPNQLTRCFELTFERGYMNEYLFEQHFHVLYWRRNVWFGVNNIIKVLEIYPKLNFVDDCEFFEGAILANIPKVKSQLNEQNTKVLIDAIQALEPKYPDLKLNSTLKFLNTHLTFCQTKLKAIENSKFYKIVLNDFEYYKIKESQRLEKEAKQAQSKN
ncbi:hypothetical protein ABPG74_017490 [Tetrahymena malaccensis]